MARKKGRKQGVPNLIREDNYIINAYGVKISQDEARRLQNVVRRVNRKRAKLEDQFRDKPIMYGSQPSGERRDQLLLMGEEMDIMVRKRSASLQQFKTRGDFTRYMKMAEKAAETDYLDYRARLYKRNYTEALKKQYAQYPDMLKGVLMKVRMMKPQDFVKWVGTDRLAQIRTHYSVSGQIDRLNALRERLGLRSYDDYEDDIDDQYYS